MHFCIFSDGRFIQKNIMTIGSNISVIIPSNHGHNDLLKIIDAVCCQTVKPFEIVIVDSSVGRGACPTEVIALCANSCIYLVYESRALAFPGQARNIGVGISQSEIVAFIDVQTIPRPNWLKTSLESISKNSLGVYGSTSFYAETWFESLVRDAFFGVFPRKTLPGSVFKREVFTKAGCFIDWVRAGEDTEWMLRLELMKIPMVFLNVALVDYVGLIGMRLNSILRKWYRNYSASHELPHLFPQKFFLWMALYPLIIFIGFNWNYLIANWRIDSPFYIGHVTKLAAVLPPLGYVFTRGILLPIRRGVSLSGLFPIRFIAILAICLMADSVKAFVFTMHKRKLQNF